MKTCSSLPLRVRRPSPKILRKLQRHRPSLKGKFAVIDTESGRYFIADRAIDALLEAHRAIPDRIFWTVRIGYRAAHKIGGRLRPL